ncbi:hypothetical protein HY312_04080 [Candidatus Saccharibacteria bacterium]|nr:hypothetical protein [Candidatus Saccharibacteria bacterium]
MSLIDDAKKKLEDAADTVKDKANDLENAAHEKKGELKGRAEVVCSRFFHTF